MRATLPAIYLASFALPTIAMATDKTDIWSFTGSDGQLPRGSLISDANGNLYGTAAEGGAAGDGTVFELTPAVTKSGSATETTLWSFSGPDGSLPSAAVIADSKGNLYGTAALDGANGGGTVFELSPPASGQTAWTETTLWSFGAGKDGKNPVGDLLIGPNGTLYGTTNWGGTANEGTVFELTSSGGKWTETVVWNFTGGKDGGQPVAGLVMDSKGALYGTAKRGGSADSGVVFQLSPPGSRLANWTENVLWAFTGGSDGAQPSGNLLMDTGGNLYGTTIFGGDTSLTLTCAQSRFPYYGEPDTENEAAIDAPYVPTGGNLCGVAFELSPGSSGGAWTMSTVHQFQGSPDGANPVAGMAMLPDGSLIGFNTKYGPGASGNGVYGNGVYGTAFQLFPPSESGGAWSVTEPFSFETTHEGEYARGTPLLSADDSEVYGTMMAGGSLWVHVKVLGDGVVFKGAPATAPTAPK
jgi:uncharacterized repeat protein (TIGR03803 family)